MVPGPSFNPPASMPPWPFCVLTPFLAFLLWTKGASAESLGGRTRSPAIQDHRTMTTSDEASARTSSFGCILDVNLGAGSWLPGAPCLKVTELTHAGSLPEARNLSIFLRWSMRVLSGEVGEGGRRWGEWRGWGRKGRRGEGRGKKEGVERVGEDGGERGQRTGRRER